MQELIAIRANLNASAFWLAALRLHHLFGKANFNPNQPRVPRGHREGGRWTREGDPHTPSSRPNLEFDEEGNPKLPEEAPKSPRAASRLSRQLADWVIRNRPSIQALIVVMRGALWLEKHVPAILSNLDGPKTLGELQRAALNPERPRGYEEHHIVERAASRSEGFREVLIEGWENKVLIPEYRHKDITGWFMRQNDDYGGLSPREYLRGKRWDTGGLACGHSLFMRYSNHEL